MRGWDGKRDDGIGWKRMKGGIGWGERRLDGRGREGTDGTRLEMIRRGIDRREGREKGWRGGEDGVEGR